MSGKIKWYAARLVAMEPAEIVHRFIEVGQKWRLKRVQDGWSAFANANHGVLADMKGLRSRLGRAASFSVDEVLTGGQFLGRKASPDLLSDNGPSRVFWFHDPISGQQWPGAECPAFDVDVRSTSATPNAARPFGDVKFVWEPNRLQILQPLAAIIAAAGEESVRARRLAFGILRSWMDANPPYRGVNWLSGIELSLRLVSLTMLVAALEPTDLSAEEREIVASFISAHARMLEALPSLYSSANNHRVAEGLGLFLAGALLPGSVVHKACRAHGQEILEGETLKQIYADGVGGEQSPTYQAFTMELIAFAALLARDEDKPFSPPTLARLAEGAKFLIDLQNDAGLVPAIGDDDEGRVILAPHCDEPLYVASVAACVATLCGLESGFAAKPGYLREQLFDVAPAPIEDGARDSLNVYQTGGYSILHRKIANHRVHLVFDHGPLGYLSLAAHGHADALSVWLSIDGRPVFIDAGTWLYHSGETTRSGLRSSLAHNTLSLAGLSQSKPSPAFSWSSKARANACERDAALIGPDTVWSMAGEHDGYLRRAKVIHRRDVIGDASSITIVDRLTGQGGQQSVEMEYLCDPAIRVVVSKGCAILSWKEDATAQPILRLRPPQGFTLLVSDAETELGPALFSPRFGELCETARILLRGELGQSPSRTLIELDTQ